MTVGQKGDNSPQEFSRYEDENGDQSALESDNTVHSSYPLKSTKHTTTIANYEDVERHCAELAVRALLFTGSGSRSHPIEQPAHSLKLFKYSSFFRGGGLAFNGIAKWVGMDKEKNRKRRNKSMGGVGRAKVTVK